MNVLIVSPHRDDAAFSLGLTIQQLLQAGHKLAVMNCFTRSDYAPFADAAFVHPNDLLSFITALRSREDEAWRRQQKSSALRFVDINLKDAPRRLRCPLAEICTRDPDPADKAIPAIRKAVEKANPEAILLPLALGGHIDHRIARTAAYDSLKGAAMAFYEDLPYAAWPEVTPGIEAFAEELGTELNAVLQPMFSSPQGADAVDLKFRAASCYDSQIDTDTTRLIANFSQRYNGAERLWANAAWRASGLLPAS